MLGYLPLTFQYAGAGVALTPAAQEAAARQPAARGASACATATRPRRCSSRGSQAPPGDDPGRADGVRERPRLTADGLPGNAVWKALIAAMIAGKQSTFGYTFVLVSEGSPETESTWHNGQTVVSGPGQHRDPRGADRDRHLPRVRARAVGDDERHEPDGSHYYDPGIQYVSYFNGGMPCTASSVPPTAPRRASAASRCRTPRPQQVYPYTPIGTLVHVT